MSAMRRRSHSITLLVAFYAWLQMLLHCPCLWSIQIWMWSQEHKQPALCRNMWRLYRPDKKQSSIISNLAENMHLLSCKSQSIFVHKMKKNFPQVNFVASHNNYCNGESTTVKCNQHKQFNSSLHNIIHFLLLKVELTC